MLFFAAEDENATRMKWIIVALSFGILGAVACADTTQKSATPAVSPTASVHSESRPSSTPTPAAERHPVPLDRMGDALLDASDLEGGTRIWTQEDGNGDNIWDNGLCGKGSGPSPVSRFARRFVGDPNSPYHGWLVESILVFPPGGATKFMDAVRASADACETELRTSGRALFRPQLPRIRNENQAFTVESFSCCVTPLPADNQQPHDIVYIRDGDIVLHLYASIDVVESAARRAEDRVDGVPLRSN